MKDGQKLQNEIFKAISKFTELSRKEYKALTEEVLSKYDVIQKKEQKEYKILNLLEKYVFAMRAEKKSEKTIEGYKLQITQFEKQVNKDIRRITTDDIRQYISYLINVRHNSDGTINNYLHILQSFFVWCKIEGYITSSPTERISIKSFKTRRIRTGLACDRLEKIKFNCRNIREQLIIELYSCTGCRLSEAAKIDIEDIDFTNNSIKICGKGNKSRIVFYSEKCKLLITEYMKENNIETGALLRSKKLPYGRLKPAAIQSIVKEIGERAGYHIYPHLLRHTFATLSRKKGMELESIQVLLGHASIVTTQIYAQENIEKVRNEYNNMIA